MKEYEKNNRLKYESKDYNGQIYQQIKERVGIYLNDKSVRRMGALKIGIKIVSFLIFIAAGYCSLLNSHSFSGLLFSYLVFGFFFLLLGLNFGHDAAHGCVTGNKKADNILLEFIFGLQGLGSHVWKIRHNFSHHIFPNVYENDTDLEVSDLILLSPFQKKLSIHKYQYLYAPLVYMIFSMTWIFYVDFELLIRKKQGNLHMLRTPGREVFKILLIKVIYLITFIGTPLMVTGLPVIQVLLAFFSMNLLVSLFLAFTFFISHHVRETEYAEADYSKEMVHDNWVRHQVISTIDFWADSVIANFIFGGFNLHTAHHLFQEVSHIYYPRVTRIIRDVLAENNLDWYRSFGFCDGVVSHLHLLKQNGEGRFVHDLQARPVVSG